MELYSENESYKLYQGSMLDMLDNIKENSIDSIVTDPPYELNFMGKGWDNAGISFNKATWSKCYEVLKPGGYLLAFGGSRTFHRIACAIEDAGFEIRDTIMWLYGSGFPKSMDISKQMDKRNGRNTNIEFKNYLNEKRKEKGYSLADINRLMDVATNGGGFASSIMGEKDNIVLPTKENYLKLKEILGLDNKYDELINITEAEREIIGKGKAGLTKGTIANFAGTTEFDITAPATDLAQQWHGWGTALKPSFEPIIVARKPFKGSLVDNVIKYDVGGINIDECRVGSSKEDIDKLNKEWDREWNTSYKSYAENVGGSAGFDYSKARVENKGLTGRFPANTILTYDETPSDERLRYFYCAKASKKDRDEGLDEFETQKVNDGRKKEIDNAFQRGETLRRNSHPTVKPTLLMQYLVRLVTPNGGIVLDPFNGSGSTGKAVMYENKEHNKNYKYIGIELTEEYLPIAKARIEYVDNEIKKNVGD